ncbi:MAG: hypothetical protein ACRELX_07365, partial [Longimicrobiales bacterium]
MMRAWLPGVTVTCRLTVAALLFAATPVRAQVPRDTIPPDTTRARPFVEGGTYDKPYLGRLLG